MIMGALNAICSDLDFNVERGGQMLMDPPGGSSMRFSVRTGLDLEVWRLSFSNIDKARRDSIKAIFDAVKYAGTILWTAPDSVSDKRYAFMLDSFESGNETIGRFHVRFGLQHMPGITV